MLFVAVLATTAVGLVVGVELAVAVVVNPIARRLPLAASLAARADAARRLGRAMPLCYLASMILIVTLAVLARGATATAIVLTAAALLAVSVVMSIVVLVPINARIAAWTPESHPADWREQQRRWDHLHGVRVGIIATAFVLVVVAVVML